MDNNRIKFRAWDIQNERMVYDPYRFEPAYLDEEKAIAPFVFYETWQDVEDGIRRSCFIEQFTGLTDKECKEIYEGDKIRVEQGECIGYDEQFNEIWKAIEGVVSFEDAMFVFDGHSAGTLPLYAYKEDIKIVGTIHQ